MSGVRVVHEGLSSVRSIVVLVHMLNPDVGNSIASKERGHDGDGGVPLAAVPAVTADLTLNEGSATGNDQLKSVRAGSGDSRVLEELVGEGANTGLGVLVIAAAASGAAVLGLGEDSSEEEEGGGEEGEHVHDTNDFTAWGAFVWILSPGVAFAPKMGILENFTCTNSSHNNSGDVI